VWHNCLTIFVVEDYSPKIVKDLARIYLTYSGIRLVCSDPRKDMGYSTSSLLVTQIFQAKCTCCVSPGCSHVTSGHLLVERFIENPQWIPLQQNKINCFTNECQIEQNRKVILLQEDHASALASHTLSSLSSPSHPLQQSSLPLLWHPLFSFFSFPPLSQQTNKQMNNNTV
jgi:hypothetical protein